MSETHDGGCECGGVRYRLTGPARTVNCCHCRDCQRMTGSAFAINAMFATEQLALTAGTPVVVDLGRDGSPDSRAWRCGACLTLLYADHPMFGDTMRFVRIGTLDEAERLPPDAHYFIRSKHPWIVIPDGIQIYETLPDRPTT